MQAFMWTLLIIHRVILVQYIFFVSVPHLLSHPMDYSLFYTIFMPCVFGNAMNSQLSVDYLNYLVDCVKNLKFLGVSASLQPVLKHLPSSTW